MLRQRVNSSNGDIEPLEAGGLLDWECGEHPETTDCREMLREFVCCLARGGCKRYGEKILSTMMALSKEENRAYRLLELEPLAKALEDGDVDEAVVRELFDKAFP